MAEYIEKIRIAVRVSMPGQEPVRGLMSLAPLAEHHPGPETLLERLNGPERFLPFEREDGATLLLARRDIVWVAAARGTDRSLVCPRTWRVTREEHVRVRLLDGHDLDGLLQMELPATSNRASDFLNGYDDYFTLAAEAGMVLINKVRVSSMRLYEGSPLPTGAPEGHSEDRP